MQSYKNGIAYRLYNEKSFDNLSNCILVGYAHYFCAGAGILSEATGFIRNEPFDVHVQPGVKHTIQVRKTMIYINGIFQLPKFKPHGLEFIFNKS